VNELMQLDLIYTFTPNVDKAVERIVDAYKFSQHLGLGKLYVAFSGGKDSVTLYGVCKLASEKLGIPLLEMADFVYNITNIDPPDLVQFIKKEFPFVIRDRPTTTFWDLVIKKGMPPTRMARYCCAALKEKGGEGKFCCTGVRWAESNARKSRGAFESIGNTKKDGRILFDDNDEDRRELEHCIPKNKYVCNAIVDWADEDVWRFIREQNLPYCKLYDEGWKRIGCIGCPNASPREKKIQFERYPKMQDQFVRTFDKLIAKKHREGKTIYQETGQEMFDWWIGGKGYIK
jgi:phosphoadenosine phosphosulfate reductase